MSGNFWGFILGCMILLGYEGVYDVLKVNDGNHIFLKLENREAVRLEKDEKPADITAMINQGNQEDISEYALQHYIREDIEASIMTGSQSLFTEDIKLNKVLLIDHELVLFFSKELLNYEGTQKEQEMINRILEIAFTNNQVEQVTITITGDKINQNQGILINGYSKEEWQKGK